MTPPTFLVVDTETSGLDPNQHALLSVALVAWSRAGIGPSLDFFVFESELVADPASMAINRIELSHVAAHGVSPVEAVKRIESFVASLCGVGQRVALAGHNVSFDIGFLKRLFRLAAHDYSRVFTHRSFDTSSVLRYLRLTQLAALEDDSSDAAFAYFGVPPAPHLRHSALGDAMATAQLITKLMELGEHLTPRGDAVTQRPDRDM